MKKFFFILISIFFFFPYVSFGSQFVFTCTNTKDKFQKTYFVDGNSKSILHLSSYDIETGKKYENLNEFLRIIDWNYPIVTGFKNTGHTISFQYFDFESNFNTSSGHYFSKRNPFSQVFDCVR